MADNNNVNPTDEQKFNAVKESEGNANAPKSPEPPKAAPKVDPNVKAAAMAAAAAQSRDAAGAYKPRYVDPGPRPDGFMERRKWVRKVKKERRKLRKDLKKEGIKSRREFEEIANELGLGLDKRRGFFFWLWWFWEWLKSAFGLGTVLALAGVLLAGMFAWSYITEQAGSFTINLTSNTMNSGFILSETIGFEKVSARLISEHLEEVNAMTLADLDENVDEIDGAHNSTHYVAYTFYIRNDGDAPQTYTYKLSMTKSVMNVDEAVWVMLFEDGHQIIYAKRSADGDEERLKGYGEYEKDSIFDNDTAYNKDEQYFEYTDENGDTRIGVKTTPYASENIVAQGIMENVEPGVVHKYTVVIWVEGNDPECGNEMFGGFAKYMMEFDVPDSPKNIFSGIYRTEYKDSLKNSSGKSGNEETENGDEAGEP